MYSTILVCYLRTTASVGRNTRDTQRRVTETLARTYEKPFSIYRPWRAGLLRNIERTDAIVR